MKIVSEGQLHTDSSITLFYRILHIGWDLKRPRYICTVVNIKRLFNKAKEESLRDEDAFKILNKLPFNQTAW